MQVVAAIIIYKSKILALQRGFSNKSYISLKYEFPGGKVKKDETFLQALEREIKEEIDIEIDNPTLYFKSKFKYPDYDVSISFYTCQVKKLKINLNVHRDYKLLSIKNLREVEWLEADYNVIEFIEKKGFAKTT